MSLQAAPGEHWLPQMPQLRGSLRTLVSHSLELPQLANPGLQG
jgi:hypothetical protein